MTSNKLLDERLQALDQKQKEAQSLEGIVLQNLNNFILLQSAFVKQSMEKNGFEIPELLPIQIHAPTASISHEQSTVQLQRDLPVQSPELFPIRSNTHNRSKSSEQSAVQLQRDLPVQSPKLIPIRTNTNNRSKSSEQSVAQLDKPVQSSVKLPVVKITKSSKKGCENPPTRAVKVLSDEQLVNLVNVDKYNIPPKKFKLDNSINISLAKSTKVDNSKCTKEVLNEVQNTRVWRGW